MAAARDVHRAGPGCVAALQGHAAYTGERCGRASSEGTRAGSGHVLGVFEVFDDVFDRGLGVIGSGIGVGLGIGVALGAAAAVRGNLRPLLRGAMKGGVALVEHTTRLTAEARETAEDLYHEASVERALEREAREASARGESAVGDRRTATVVIPRPSRTR